MPINIIIQQGGASPQQVIKKYTEIYQKLMNPDPTKAVHNVATLWGSNYRSEGGMVGGWTALAQSTIDQRVSQGFGAGPILLRAGGLYAMSTLFFMQAERSQSAASTTHYGGTNVTTTANLDISNGTAVLSVSGPKVANQFRAGRRPARPYWFTNPNIVAAARLGVVDWITHEVVK